MCTSTTVTCAQSSDTKAMSAQFQFLPPMLKLRLQTTDISMRDWFIGALSNPDQVEDKAEEANFIADIPGVQPFPCEVAP